MTRYPTVYPYVQIVDYGPKLIDPKTGEILMTPDEIVALSSGWTYKNTDAFQNYKILKEEEKDLSAAAKKILLAAAGRGHASLSTSMGLWLNIQNSSKMVDSYFTGATFGSSLMPSGRRTGINLDQIVIPKNISSTDHETREIYIRASENNIRTYEELMAAGIKQDAAGKIVQYGISGGGFMYLPIETLVGFSRDSKQNFNWIPEEIHDILDSIVEKLPGIGMAKTYSARTGAARSSYPWPTIFKSPNKENLISSLINKDKTLREAPKIMDANIYITSAFNGAFEKYSNYLKGALSSPESVLVNWEETLQNGGEIVKAFNSGLEVIIDSVIPWRVWGEVKRHRTMQQNPESIYSALKRAMEYFDSVQIKYDGMLFENPSKFMPELKEFEGYVSIPPDIQKSPELTKKWLQAFYQSFDAYNKLVKTGIPESDALQVIPRGLKLGNEKTLDLYNLIFGYLPLRLCGTAEEEMKRLSQQEFHLIQDSKQIPDAVKGLIRPKCGVVGFCLEPWSKCKNCLQVQKYIPFKYTEEIHGMFDTERIKGIEEMFN